MDDYLIGLVKNMFLRRLTISAGYKARDKQIAKLKKYSWVQ